jgi:protein-tyrosine phosphatase
MIQQRLVPVEGAMNFRDVGGYPTADGRRVRWGMLYRSDSLHLLTDEDLVVVANLGLRTVIDLRAGDEVDLEPSRLPEGGGIQRRHLPMFDPAGVGEGEAIIDRIVGGGFAEYGPEMVTEFYLDMLRRFAPVFGEIVTHAADAERLPLLFHCAAGKDRTGVAAALTLSMLGVPDEHVVADYVLTEERLRDRGEAWRPILRERGLPDEAITLLLGAPAEALVQTLEALRRDHGSIEGYLTGPAGADPEALATLRELVLETGDP